MAEMIFSWVSDRLASSDIIDLYFVLSDLADITLTESEYYESAYFDSMATHTLVEIDDNKYENIPLGKLVL